MKWCLTIASNLYLLLIFAEVAEIVALILMKKSAILVKTLYSTSGASWSNIRYSLVTIRTLQFLFILKTQGYSDQTQHTIYDILHSTLLLPFLQFLLLSLPFLLFFPLPLPLLRPSAHFLQAILDKFLLLLIYLLPILLDLFLGSLWLVHSRYAVYISGVRVGLREQVSAWVIARVGARFKFWFEDWRGDGNIVEAKWCWRHLCVMALILREQTESEGEDRGDSVDSGFLCGHPPELLSVLKL